jgi:hypothetical protein
LNPGSAAYRINISDNEYSGAANFITIQEALYFPTICNNMIQSGSTTAAIVGAGNMNGPMVATGNYYAGSGSLFDNDIYTNTSFCSNRDDGRYTTSALGTGINTTEPTAILDVKQITSYEAGVPLLPILKLRDPSHTYFRFTGPVDSANTATQLGSYPPFAFSQLTYNNDGYGAAGFSGENGSVSLVGQVNTVAADGYSAVAITYPVYPAGLGITSYNKTLRVEVTVVALNSSGPDALTIKLHWSLFNYGSLASTLIGIGNPIQDSFESTGNVNGWSAILSIDSSQNILVTVASPGFDVYWTVYMHVVQGGN